MSIPQGPLHYSHRLHRKCQNRPQACLEGLNNSTIWEKRVTLLKQLYEDRAKIVFDWNLSTAVKHKQWNEYSQKTFNIWTRNKNIGNQHR